MFLLFDADVPPEQRNTYKHFDVSEEEMRILKQNNLLMATGSSSRATLEVEEEREERAGEAHPALRAVAMPESHAGQELGPLGLPLKKEVTEELAEMDEVHRAARGLRRLLQDEAALLHNQMAQLQVGADVAAAGSSAKSL
jgi:hypothetical protein